MKITKSKLRQIIKEELEKVLDEGGFVQHMKPAPASQRGPRPPGSPQTPEEAEAAILDPTGGIDLSDAEKEAVRTLGAKFAGGVDAVLKALTLGIREEVKAGRLPPE